MGLGLAAFAMLPAFSGAAQDPVPLRSAANFAVLAGSTVTNAASPPPTTINGNLGVSPGTAVTGFPPGVVTGAIHAGDGAASIAQSDLTTAYNDAADRIAIDVHLITGDMGGMTLPPGLYKSATNLSLDVGNLTLDGEGDPNAIWVFQMGSTLTVATGRQMFLARGARAANIYWQVGSDATFDTFSVIKGNVMADQSVVLSNGASLEGRALARIGQVTLDANTITPPAPWPGRTVGDFDNSGCTDVNDYLYLLDNWMTEVDGNLIDVDDFLALLDNWMLGTTCN